MAWVATKSMFWGGRQVNPGDPLPDVDAWGAGRQRRYEAAGKITEVPDGHAFEVVGGKWRVVRATSPAKSEPMPPESAAVEPATPALAPSASPGRVVVQPKPFVGSKGKKKH